MAKKEVPPPSMSSKEWKLFAQLFIDPGGALICNWNDQGAVKEFTAIQLFKRFGADPFGGFSDAPNYEHVQIGSRSLDGEDAQCTLVDIAYLDKDRRPVTTITYEAGPGKDFMVTDDKGMTHKWEDDGLVLTSFNKWKARERTDHYYEDVSTYISPVTGEICTGVTKRIDITWAIGGAGGKRGRANGCSSWLTRDDETGKTICLEERKYTDWVAGGTRLWLEETRTLFFQDRFCIYNLSPGGSLILDRNIKDAQRRPGFVYGGQSIPHQLNDPDVIPHFTNLKSRGRESKRGD